MSDELIIRITSSYLLLPACVSANSSPTSSASTGVCPRLPSLPKHAGSRHSLHQNLRQPEQQRQTRHVCGCGEHNARSGGGVGTELLQSEWPDGAADAADDAAAGHGEEHDGAEHECDGQVLGGSEERRVG